MEDRKVKERKFWDRFAGKYDSFISHVVKKTYISILENIDSELNTDQCVLEIGTGTGIISFSICSKVSSIIATDISPEMIRIANNVRNNLGKNNISFQVQDSYKLTFPDNSFDMVIASNLLHLLYEPEKPLKEVKRVLKDNGIFIAPTFCVGENIKSVIITTIVGFFSGFKVVNKWSSNDYKAMLINNGFTINKEQKINGKFPLTYIVLKK